LRLSFSLYFLFIPSLACLLLIRIIFVPFIFLLLFIFSLPFPLSSLLYSCLFLLRLLRIREAQILLPLRRSAKLTESFRGFLKVQPSLKCCDSTLNYVSSASSQIPSVSPFISSHSTVWNQSLQLRKNR
jgi:hypothetical protein